MPEFESIIGRFFSVGIDGAEHRIYIEEAGKGIPLLPSNVQFPQDTRTWTRTERVFPETQGAPVRLRLL